MPERGPRPAPGQAAEMEITGIGEGGEGVGRIGGMTVFVPGAMPGDLILAEVTEVRRNYCRANIQHILRPSEHRADPCCPAAAECGGCQIQHIEYQEQLRLKTQAVRDALRRIGGLDPELVLPAIGAANPWGYRNKAQFPVGLAAADVRSSKNRGNGGNSGARGCDVGGTRRIVAGCYARGTHRIIDTDVCLIQHPTNNRILAAAKRLIGKFGYSIYDETTGRGLIRHILARTGLRTGQSMAVVVTNGETFPKAGDFARHLMDEVPGLAGVLQNINTGRTNVILGGRTHAIAGSETIEDIIGGLRFKISARSFFQVNTEQTEVLYRKALEYAGIPSSNALVAVDAYCGIGTITLLLARAMAMTDGGASPGTAGRGTDPCGGAGHGYGAGPGGGAGTGRSSAGNGGGGDPGGMVYGIEIIPEAVADAQANAKLNGIENAEFRCGRVEEAGPQLLREGVRPDVVVVDPPRKGCERSVLETFAAMGPKRIVYVSCNPATLARDLAYLSELGYETRAVQPVDMFPQTGHVECVVLMSRVEND